MDNRFKYLDELSDDELLASRVELVKEIEYLLERLEIKNTNGTFKSEIQNSDIKYEREKLEYINYLIDARNLKDKVK